MTSLLHSIGIEHVNVVCSSAVITIILIVIALLATRRMELVPHGLQNVAEWAIGGLHGFFDGVMGEYANKKYFPIVGTLFIYILFSNYFGLLPLSGHMPHIAAPSSSINQTAGMAIVVFFAVQIIGIHEKRCRNLEKTGRKGIGLSFFGHLFKPFAFLFPIMLLEQFVRPLSLTLRLYGNIFGEEAVVNAFFNLIPIGLPVVMQFLSVLMGLVQALVFSLLTAIYIGEVCEEEEE